MGRLKPKPPVRPYFESRPDLAKLLSDDIAQRPAAADDGQDEPRDTRDWVQREEDEFIEARPHLRAQRDLITGTGTFLDLSGHIIRARREADAMSQEQFRARLEEEGVIDLLKREGAFREDEHDVYDHIERRELIARTWAPVELYVLFLNSRWTEADDELAKYRSADGANRIMSLIADLGAGAQALRQIVAIAECGPSRHPLPDELRRHAFRAGGRQPDHPGWLQALVRWTNELPLQLRTLPTKTMRETAFMRAWYELAMKRTPNSNAVIWEAGRLLFRITFPVPDRYHVPGDYRRVVRQRLTTRRPG